MRSLVPTKSMHIKGIHNTVADAISRLDFGQVQDEKANWMTFMKCWCQYTIHAPTEESTLTCQYQINMVFTNRSEEDVIYPFNSKGNCTSPGGRCSPEETKQNKQYSTQVVEDTQVLCKDGKMVISKVLQYRAVSCYHHYLQHPGHTCLEETLHAAMFWTGMRNTIRSHVENCCTQVNK